jgi:hypothetical protein
MKYADFPDLFRSKNTVVETIDEIYKFWRLFYEIYEDIIAEGACDYTKIKEETTKWNILFRSIYVDLKATPYIHYFCCHLWQDVKEFGDINLYNVQGKNQNSLTKNIEN